MKYLLYISFVLISGILSGQIIEAETDPCLLNLNNAETSYEGGNIEEIPGLIKECLDQNGFKSKENRTKAYRLLINSYVFQSMEDSADVYMVKFLKYDPEFRPSEQIDRREFIDLHNSYRNYPVFGVGAKFGLGLSQLMVINEFGAHNIEANSSNTKYKVNLGFSVEGFLSYHPHRDGEIFIDFGYNNYSFTEETRLFTYAFPVEPGYENYTQYIYKETVNSLNLSLGYKYMFRKNIYSKVIPYIGVGIRGGLLMASNIDISRTIHEGADGLSTIKGSILTANHLRNRWNTWVAGILGLKIKIPKGNIFLETGYDYNLYNISNPNERFNLNQETTNELLFKYFYVSNDFRLNNFFVKLGYNYNFYIPKKTGNKKARREARKASQKQIKNKENE